MATVEMRRAATIRGVLALAVFLAVATAMAAPTGQEAVERVKAMLTGFGVPGPLRLQYLGTVESPEPGRRQIVVTSASGTPYTAWVAPNGGVLSITQEDSRKGVDYHSAWHSPRAPRPLTGAEHERRVQKWLAATGTQEPTRLGKMTVNDKGIAHAYLPVLRNGYPFVSYQEYGYKFTFVASTGEFLAYDAWWPPVPPVAPGEPRLNKEAALAAFKRIWQNEIAPRAWKEDRERAHYKLGTKLDLGYFLPEGRSTAILVWRVPYIDYRTGNYATRVGGNGMLIDAVTGKRVPTKYVP